MKFKTFKDFNNRKTAFKVCLDFLGNLFFCYCLIIALALILFSSVTVECEVIGSSMLPTFNNYSGNKHDVVYINIYDKDLSRGDIVVCDADSESIIKRVIGIEGDVVDIVRLENEYKLELNGELVNEDYIYVDNDPRIETINKNGMENTYKKFESLKSKMPNLFNDDGKLVVPDNSVFVLGDNRQVSVDSSSIGTFDLSKVEGKVELVKYYDMSTFSFYYDYILEGKFFYTLINIF